ncbi:L-galactonate-5-dehydrogenase [Emticicia aquatica]|uniref:L-galactonate-5-dehydrogenase n=1 Tax=Emticicia aquatica TaxID=1681835 RepID=A0ABM9AMS3_9BACT|nr:zinc-binding alcohol dehydrogenase family protein [Emticicia aquatica]CAH0994812.1 L-galactonate-5-dehydrogenase [Emticicia aquatica]
MKQLVCKTPKVFEYESVIKPTVSTGRAIIKVKRIGICGTDIHAFDGTQPYFNYPRILGHELAGEIIEIAPQSDFFIGENVTIIPYFSCGKCVACRQNKPNCCVDIKVFGVHIDGGMSEFISVPIEYLIKNKNLTLEELALVEPLAIGLHGIRRAEVTKNDFVLVVGAGPIGLGVIEFAKITGATVIVLDVNDDRLSFCKNKLGISHVINPKSEDVLTKLAQITNGDMANVVIDATGNLNAINQSFKYLAHGGRYVLVGLQKGEITINHPEFHKREATLMSSRNATRSDFEYVMQCIENKTINPNHYITHQLNFEKVKDEFEELFNPSNGVIKAMIFLD